MYLRIDPSRSAGNDYFILDSDASLADLKSRDSLPCDQGGHQKLNAPQLVTTQDITCDITTETLYTIIYSAQ